MNDLDQISQNTQSSCLILAGEKSGEEHCMSFLPALVSRNPQMTFFGVGGDEMMTQGFKILYHLKDFSTFGVTEAIKKLPFYYRAFHSILNEVKTRKCQNAILIDFQDFNFRLAQKLTQLGVRVFYYVAPQAWAWKEFRGQLLANRVYTLFCLLSFEKKWFTDRGVKNVIHVEHPLSLKYSSLLKLKPKAEKSQVLRILILPGSRNFEVNYLLPIFTSVIKTLKKSKKIHTSIVKSSSVKSINFLSNQFSWDQEYGPEKLHEALLDADICLAASGTVTLACALFQVPTVVCYRGNLLNAFFFFQFVKYNGFISLPNLILGKSVFPEFLQDRVTEFNLLRVLQSWVDDDQQLEKIKQELALIAPKLKGDNIEVANYIHENFL
jgi:lipid-A-disaccharide synthase